MTSHSPKKRHYFLNTSPHLDPRPPTQTYFLLKSLDLGAPLSEAWRLPGSELTKRC